MENNGYILPNVSSWEVRRNASLGDSYNSQHKVIQTIARTYITPGLCMFGILGNIVNLIVLTRLRLYKLENRNDRGANLGLAVLAVSDMMLCLALFPAAFTDPTFAVFRQRSFLLYYQAYGTGVVTTFILTSTWITLTLAVIRYFVICHPFSMIAFYSRRAVRPIYFIVCVVAVTINVPTFLHFQISEIGYVDNTTLYFIDLGIMDGKTTLSQVFQWIKFTVFIAIPALILVFCNCSLVSALHSSGKLRQQYQANKGPIKRQNRVTMIMIIIALGFILLVFPSELMDFFMDYVKLDPSRTELFLTLRVFANLLQMINFSCNFLLYCALNVHFRHVFRDVFLCGVARHNVLVARHGEFIDMDTTRLTQSCRSSSFQGKLLRHSTK